MKTTMVELKNKAKKMADKTGYQLFKGNVYFANDGYIKALKNAVEVMATETNERRYQATEKQIDRLNNWIDELEYKYLIN